jgi:uncharacterized repeat protein (TIGR01451 family)
MALQSAGQMSFADVYNEITGESLTNPPISITLAELGQLLNAQGQQIPLNQNSEFKPDGILPTVFPTEWYKYCQICNVPKPFLTISKSAPGQAFNNQNFNFTITITNNGESATSGIIFVTDTLATNLIFQGVSGTSWSGSVANNVVNLQYSGTLGVGQSTQVNITVKTFANATYNNFAQVTGGGDSIVRFSNTTTTQVITQTFTSTQTVRLDRTFQKNDCGSFGTGTYEQIYSPYFTNTYTSVISQADADSNAYQISFGQASSWLDANGQNQANIQGSCVFEYPVVQLALFISPTSINIGSTGTVTLNITNQVVATNGNITLQMTLPTGTSYNGIISVPSFWSVNVSGQVVSFTTSQSLSSSYSASIIFSLYANTVGTYSFRATGSGGNMQNNFTASNFINFNVFAQPSYSFGAFAENLDFNSREQNPAADIRAVPTDRAYYTGFVNITNGNSGQDGLSFSFVVPSFFPGNEAQVIFDNPYFEASYSFVLSPPQFTITNNQFNIPVGQYYFRIYLPMAIDYFRANTSGQSGLVINQTGQAVQFLEQLQGTFYFRVNNVFLSQRTILIRWASNYMLAHSFNFSNTPNTLQNLQLAYQNYYQNSYTYLQLTASGSNLNIQNIWYINPTRNAGFVASGYPLTYTVNGRPHFGVYVYLILFYNGSPIAFTNNTNSIDSSENTGIKIDNVFNDPFTRNIRLTIQVDGSGNFVNI